jgi:hypothetical protein
MDESVYCDTSPLGIVSQETADQNTAGAFSCGKTVEYRVKLLMPWEK